MILLKYKNHYYLNKYNIIIGNNNIIIIVIIILLSLKQTVIKDYGTCLYFQTSCKIKKFCDMTLREKCPKKELFLIHIFLNLDRRLIFAEQISVFSSNSVEHLKMRTRIKWIFFMQ